MKKITNKKPRSVEAVNTHTQAFYRGRRMLFSNLLSFSGEEVTAS